MEKHSILVAKIRKKSTPLPMIAKRLLEEKSNYVIKPNNTLDKVNPPLLMDHRNVVDAMMAPRALPIVIGTMMNAHTLAHFQEGVS